tara:strand:+ start:1288 stop:1683 length:396 start_codon:yes stop_codon:yes gene_type:complete
MQFDDLIEMDTESYDFATPEILDLIQDVEVTGIEKHEHLFEEVRHWILGWLEARRLSGGFKISQTQRCNQISQYLTTWSRVLAQVAVDEGLLAWVSQTPKCWCEYLIRGEFSRWQEISVQAVQRTLRGAQQ